MANEYQTSLSSAINTIEASRMLIKTLQNLVKSEEIKSESACLKKLEDCINDFETAREECICKSIINSIIDSLESVLKDINLTFKEKESKILKIVGDAKGLYKVGE